MTDGEKKPGTEPTAEPSLPASSQFTAAEVNLGRDRTNQPKPKDGGDVQQRETSRRGGRGLLLVFFGIIMGVAIALVAPRYAQPYLRDLPVALSQDTMAAGTVMEKHVEDERVVLRVSTEEGVTLAIFTQNLGDIDLLIGHGDWVELGAGRYEPFLNDPAIRRVRPAETDPQGDIPAAPRGIGTPGPAGKRSGASPESQPAPESQLADQARVDDQRRMEDQLAQLEAQVTAFELRLISVETDLSDAARRQLDELRELSATARTQLERTKTATVDAWQDLRVGFDESWENLREALMRARSRFGEDGSASPPAIPEPPPATE